MGNTLGRKKTTKIMKIDGETMKFKTPVQAGVISKDYPGCVLLDSEAVKHFGIRAKPLGHYQKLMPRRLYFLVELPNKSAEENKLAPTKVQSGINMSTKDRLESLSLARKSVSDLSLMQEKSSIGSKEEAVRVKMKLPKAEVVKLMSESKSGTEVAEKIMQLCLGSTNVDQRSVVHTHANWKEVGDGRVSQGVKAQKKRVSFLPVNEG